MQSVTGVGGDSRLAGATALITIGLGAVVGLALQLSATQWLSLGLGTSLSVWVGGAVTTQIVLAQLLDRARAGQLADFVKQLMWLVTKIYVPSSVVAVGCGLTLVVIHHLRWLSLTVMVPLALYGALTFVGIVISKPGSARVFMLAEQPGEHDQEIRARVAILAWVNRAELVLAAAVGFPLIASTICS